MWRVLTYWNWIASPYIRKRLPHLVVLYFFNCIDWYELVWFQQRTCCKDNSGSVLWKTCNITHQFYENITPQHAYITRYCTILPCIMVLNISDNSMLSTMFKCLEPSTMDRNVSYKMSKWEGEQEQLDLYKIHLHFYLWGTNLQILQCPQVQDEPMNEGYRGAMPQVFTT